MRYLVAPGPEAANLASLPRRRYSCGMRPLRYSINVTLDRCCDHRAMFADEDLHRHAAENLDHADARLFGRVTYEMMEAAWRPSAPTGARPDWMEPFARAINAAKKYVASGTLVSSTAVSASRQVRFNASGTGGRCSPSPSRPYGRRVRSLRGLWDRP